MTQVFRATGSPPAVVRFDAWLQMVEETATPVEVRSSGITTFAASVTMSNVGVLQILDLRHPPVEIDRTRRLIRRADPEVYHLALNVEGRQCFTQERNVTDLQRGDMVLYHSSRTFSTRSDSRAEQEAAIVVVIPPGLLPLPADRLRRLLGVRLSGRDAIGSLVSSYLRALAKGAAGYHGADAARLSHVTLDLIAAMLAHHLDAATSVPPHAREQALFATIQAHIHRHLGDSTLRPESIAAAHHISVHTLHRLFQAHGHTVAGWIRQLRLDRCRHDLTDPMSPERSVHAIGSRWGFPHITQFSRAFKAEYGLSPRDYRQQHAAQRAQATARLTS